MALYDKTCVYEMPVTTSYRFVAFKVLSKLDDLFLLRTRCGVIFPLSEDEIDIGVHRALSSLQDRSIILLCSKATNNGLKIELFMYKAAGNSTMKWLHILPGTP